jgi:flavin reductase (DIM6/NTAB) family NADH-FMN oxidoreductase RutF
MDTKAKRTALRMLTHGLYILTTGVDGSVFAATISWLSQVSIDPLLVMVALRQGTIIHCMTEASRCFTVNILGHNQQRMAKAFFKPMHVTQAILDDYAYRLSPSGCPILEDVPAWLECQVLEDYTGQGDHTLFLGLVTNACAKPGAPRPLALHTTPWSYGA